MSWAGLIGAYTHEELGYSVEERSAELEIMQLEGESPCGGDAMVSPAVFLNPGPVPLNELAVVMDVRPVREQEVCCALVQHKAKEGSHWWEICGGRFFFLVEEACAKQGRRAHSRRLHPDWAARPALMSRAAHAVESKAVVHIEVAVSPRPCLGCAVELVLRVAPLRRGVPPR
jgi:hypothetical protein